MQCQTPEKERALNVEKDGSVSLDSDFLSFLCPLLLQSSLSSLVSLFPEVFGLVGISHSGYLWGTQRCYPTSPSSDPGSRQHLVLLSPESLFNIISFLLTFIKTNIELRRVYTPTRDTLHFDIKNKRKQNLNSPNLRPRGERKRREKGGEKKYPRDIFTFKGPSLITVYHRHVYNLIFLQFSVK